MHTLFPLLDWKFKLSVSSPGYNTSQTSYLAMRDSAALMLPARCSRRTAASHSSAVCGFFNRACMHGSSTSEHDTLASQLDISCKALSC